jgi:hypothetical protein
MFFEKGDLVFDTKHPGRHGFVCEVLIGKNSDRDYLEVRWLNFPWGNPHTRTLEIPKDITILAKGNKNEK